MGGALFIVALHCPPYRAMVLLFSGRIVYAFVCNFILLQFWQVFITKNRTISEYVIFGFWVWGVGKGVLREREEEKCYSEVPENKKYKLKIIDTEKTDKIGYKLKKGTKLPYNTILKGSNSSISSTCLISIYFSPDYDVCFEKSLKPVLKGFNGSEDDGWWTLCQV